MILNGDCIGHMKQLTENSVDAIVTDPPYGIGFMGKEWDNFKPSTIKQGMEKDTRLKTQIASTRISNIAGTYDLSLSGNQKFQKWFEQIAKECLRVIKPGGYLLVFGGTRTYHRLVCGIEDAGFEIRDTIMWLYGSGFPKSLNIGKQIDKMGAKDISWFGKWLREWRNKRGISSNDIGKLFPSKTGNLTGCVRNWELGLNLPSPEQFSVICKEFNLPFESIEEAKREVIGKDWRKANYSMFMGVGNQEWDLTTPATPEAQGWEGWGTALKPACEPIVVARKPLSEKNVALNVLKWGTGGINIDASRIESGTEHMRGNVGAKIEETDWKNNSGFGKPFVATDSPLGRFPANIILDEEAGKMLDEQSGDIESGYRKNPSTNKSTWFGAKDGSHIEGERGYKDKGGASRFFYCAKASKSERNLGCEDLEERETAYGKNMSSSDTGTISDSKLPTKNNHPTVKPIKLMEYLIKLVTKEGAVVLDPFLGSGTTAVACQKLGRLWIGIEKEPEYIKIAEARIKHYSQQKKLMPSEDWVKQAEDDINKMHPNEKSTLKLPLTRN